MPEDTAPMSVALLEPPVVPAATDPYPLLVDADPPPPNVTRSMYMCLIGFGSIVQAMWSWLLSEFPEFFWQTMVNLITSSALSYSTGFLCWLIYFRPFDIQPRIDSALLTTFDLGPSSALLQQGNELLYDLSLNILFLNSPAASSMVHFDHLTTGLYYNGTKIGPSDDTLPSFKLDTGRRWIVHSVLSGRATAPVAEAFAVERAQGKFNLNVRVKTTLSYWFFPHKGTYYYQYDCGLQFPPVPGDGTPAATGGGFKCSVAK